MSTTSTPPDHDQEARLAHCTEQNRRTIERLRSRLDQIRQKHGIKKEEEHGSLRS